MIPFNRPYLTGNEIVNIQKALEGRFLSGDGSFTKFCHHWLEGNTGTHKALLTQSCTAALEMAALLLEIKAGDEVIMPSYTFVSTANAFVLRGGVPVFVDIRSDTLNLDESLIEQAITKKTKAILPVHYAGVACDMSSIMALAKAHKFKIVEDAAQGLMASYKGKALGTFGDLGCYSFHDSKNISAGEGGCLLVNDPNMIERAEILREKGTDRSKFFRGQVDKYTWVDQGSSYLPSEITAAFLAAQLEKADEITKKRLSIWQSYHDAFLPLEQQEKLRRPVVSTEALHNAHIYYFLLSDEAMRARFMAHMQKHGVSCVSHYIPLHTSPYGSRHGRASGRLPVTERSADTLVRLPLWPSLTEKEQQKIIESVFAFFT